MYFTKRIKIWTNLLLMLVMLISPGCMWWRGKNQHEHHDTDIELYKNAATAIEYPDVDSCGFDELASTGRPRTLVNREPTEYWNLSLEECMHMALKNSKVLRDLGGAVLDAPDSVQTIYDPARGEADPRFGVEAALSAFDAEWSTQAFFEKNDKAVNNQFFGGGTRLFKQDLLDYSSQLSKQTATGAILSVRHNAQYDFNNAPGNATPNLPWGTNFEVEFRQPILQGAGVQFNRIAGPNATPGVYNGVMIARIRTDIALADFQEAVTDLVFSVEYLYWELYSAYRKLDSKVAARDRALETWRIVNSQKDRLGAAEEAQAREQYYRLEADVQNALNGQLQEKAVITAFRGTAGVYVNERRLRLLMGLPINDGRLIRPSNEPVMAKIVFDWNEALIEALMRRTVLRRQKWRIKQRELEMIASKNFMRPRLDTIGRYRWRGLGHDLITHSADTDFDSAFGNLLNGDFQEWQAGFELSFPAGWRQASAGVRNAELNLAREHALLYEQEREVTNDLSNAFGELERAYIAAKLNYNRRLAARQQLAALEAKRDQETRYLNLVLDAQRRLAEADIVYHSSMAEYMLAVRHVHRSKGSLLDYNEIHLAEGPWPEKAYRNAARRERLRVRSWHLENFVMQNPPPVSNGPIPQDVDSSDAEPMPAEVIPLPESNSSPLPPAPPSVRPDNDVRLFESARNVSTRRSLEASQKVKHQGLAASPQRPVRDMHPTPAATGVEGRIAAKRASSGQSLTPQRRESAPVSDLFKNDLQSVNSSVLSGSLLARALAEKKNSQNTSDRGMVAGPVVRFAAEKPKEEFRPTTRFAGGQVDPTSTTQNRQTAFEATPGRPPVNPRNSPASSNPQGVKPARTAVPSAKAGQESGTKRSSSPKFKYPTTSSPNATNQLAPPPSRTPQQETRPVVRYFDARVPPASSGRKTTVPTSPPEYQVQHSRKSGVTAARESRIPSGRPRSDAKATGVRHGSTTNSPPPAVPFQYPDTSSRTYSPAPIVEH